MYSVVSWCVQQNFIISYGSSYSVLRPVDMTMNLMGYLTNKDQNSASPDQVTNFLRYV